MVEMIEAWSGLLVAIGVAIPTVWGIWEKVRGRRVVEALHDVQRAIGEGGEVRDVVRRIKELRNPVIEDELERSGAVRVRVDA